MQSIFKRSLWWVETMIVVIVLAMVLLTFSDVIGRRIFGAPIYGANDITEHLMGLMVFAGLPIVTAVGAHLSVDLLGKVLDLPALRIWGIVTGLAVAILVAVLRVPLAFALLGTSIVGLGLVINWNTAFLLLPLTISDAVLSYDLAVVPMFILMSNVISKTGIAHDLFRAAYAFVGNVRGGLALSTMAACSGFAAVSGSS